VNDYLRNEDVQDFGCKNRLPPAANFVFAFPTPAAWHLTPQKLRIYKMFKIPRAIRKKKTGKGR